MYQVSRLDLRLSVGTTYEDSGSLSPIRGDRMTKDDKQGHDESGDPQLAPLGSALGSGASPELCPVRIDTSSGTGRTHRLRIFGTKAEQLRQAQQANDRRGRLLLVASSCLAVAIGSLAVLAAFLIVT